MIGMIGMIGMTGEGACSARLEPHDDPGHRRSRRGEGLQGVLDEVHDDELSSSGSPETMIGAGSVSGPGLPFRRPSWSRCWSPPGTRPRDASEAPGAGAPVHHHAGRPAASPGASKLGGSPHALHDVGCAVGGFEREAEGLLLTLARSPLGAQHPDPSEVVDDRRDRLLHFVRE